MRVQGPYGTRSSTALTVKASAEVSFFEMFLDKNTWKEKTVRYYIRRPKSWIERYRATESQLQNKSWLMYCSLT
ncbi:hypothetical protein CIPAW_10G100400 [Carya illinoinensis]|uniref:Uncharacterized protein n=1 Tax=Carya illinoinensis TaxID=32201 RepID=A0A8T1P697_CARIL|nr:hypothetical protein CIPAW_10G100400 [Carya illinoinensis]